MIVEYKTNKIKKQCENPRIAQKDYGSNIGYKLTQRVEELLAATSLLDIKLIPAASDLKGQDQINMQLI
jgi:proteic killer suppression protein